MNQRLHWGTWPTWVFYGWYWWPRTWIKLLGEDSIPAILYVIDMVSKKDVDP